MCPHFCGLLQQSPKRIFGGKFIKCKMLKKLKIWKSLILKKKISEFLLAGNVIDTSKFYPAGKSSILPNCFLSPLFLTKFSSLCYMQTKFMLVQNFLEIPHIKIHRPFKSHTQIRFGQQLWDLLLNIYWDRHVI